MSEVALGGPGRSYTHLWISVSPLSLVKNPMILLAIAALGITLGMPKLMENSTCLSSLFLLRAAPPWRDWTRCAVSNHRAVDPEMRAEFEQHSRSSPLTGATNNAMAGSGFDLAGWMAGTSPSPMANADAALGGATGRDAGGSARRRG